MPELISTGARLIRKILSQSKTTDKKAKKRKSKIARQRAVKVNLCQKQKLRISRRVRNSWKKTHSLKSIMMRMATLTGLESQVGVHLVRKKSMSKSNSRMS